MAEQGPEDAGGEWRSYWWVVGASVAACRILHTFAWLFYHAKFWKQPLKVLAFLHQCVGVCVCKLAGRNCNGGVCGRFPGSVGVCRARLIREAEECWWGVAKHTDKAVNHSGTHAVITAREGGCGRRARLQLLQLNHRNVSVQQPGPLSLSFFFNSLLFWDGCGATNQLANL